jgi:flagellar biosynthesis/type III secretory pathway protein FliH
MRSVPAARPGNGRPPFEFRVRFPSRLADSLLEAPAAQSNDRSRQAAPSAADDSAHRTANTTPTDFWQTDAGRELQADRERIENVLAQVRSGVASLREDQAKRLSDWQRAAIELATTIAARLLHRKVVAGEFPMEAKVRDMIAQLEDDVPVAIHLNPADLALLEKRLAGEPLLPGRDDPRVAPDPNLARGECRVEAREGMLLSDMTRELTEIRDELLRSLAHART